MIRSISIRHTEKVLWVLGIACVLPWMAAESLRYVYAQPSSEAHMVHDAAAPALQPGNWSDWSAERQLRFMDWLLELPDPVGTLRFSDGAQVPLFAEENDRTMTVGAACIDRRRPIHENQGNIVLSSHRDGHFRRLKEVQVGDEFALTDRFGRRNFQVEEMFVTRPDAVEVLRDHAAPTLTLITCHPFYFAGNAPERFIVVARQVHSEPQIASA